ncbi:MazG-like family protein [Leuconostoc lactis]
MNELIIKWAVERGLDKPENATKQLTKAMEELGELSAGINKQDRDKQIDSLGDLQVVLIILSMQLGIDYIGSLESAYEVIKNRTGKTINGVFVKSEDM